MNDAMIDIETWGTGTNALVVSIGAVEFDLDTGELGCRFQMNIRPKTAQDAGFVIDADTVGWWLQQSDEARASFRVRLESAWRMFTDLSRFLKGMQVWSNGENFDIRILREGYALLGIKCPWHFRDARDMRTFMDTMKRLGVEVVPEHGPALKHDALADAEFQARLMIDHWKELKGMLNG